MDKKQTPNLLIKCINSIFTAPVILLIVWEMLSRFNIISSIYFPSPSDIFLRFSQLLFINTGLLSDIGFSLKRLIFGVIISVPLAVLSGMAIGLSQKISAFITPLISITYPIPKLSILPFLMIVFGIGDASKVAIISIGIFYLVLLNVIYAVKGLPRIYFDIIFIYRIPFLKRNFSVVLKGILPDILNGCKIGIGYGLVMVVASEFIAARNGIGFFMWNAWDQFRIKDLYVGLLIFSLMGIVIFFVFDWLISRLKWKGKSRYY